MQKQPYKPRVIALCVMGHLAGVSLVRAGDPLGLLPPATAPGAAPPPIVQAPATPEEAKALAVFDGLSITAGRWRLDAPPRLTEARKPINVSMAPYAWLTSQAGDVTLRGITLDADVSFADLVHQSDSLVALMGAVDLEYERYVFQFNAEYARVQFKGSRGVFRNGTVSADVTETLGWYELFGGYQLLEWPMGEEGAKRRLTMDTFVGGRVTAIDLNASLSTSTTVTLPDGDILNAGTNKDRGGSRDWLEPFVGARVGLDLSDHWLLSLRGDVGGFGISGAESAWSAAALVGYRWTMDGWTLTAFGGYRVLSQDYASGGFGWEVTTYGPLLGAQFSVSF